MSSGRRSSSPRPLSNNKRTENVGLTRTLYPTSPLTYLTEQLSYGMRTLASLTIRPTSSPISVLPEDILSVIFCLVIDYSYDPSWYWIIKITSVCRYWRRVAIDCAPLWTRLDLRDLKWTTKMLIRSKEAALTVSHRSTLSTQEHVDCFRLCIESLGRIRVLRVTLNRLDLMEWIDLPAAAMEELYLSIPGHLGPLPGQTSWLAYPATFLGGRAPRLRSLTLKGRCLPWASPLLSNHITTLHFELKATYTNHEVEVEQPPGFSMADFVAALERMPCLTNLHLAENAVPAPQAERLRRIFLSNLENLSIIAPYYRIQAILEQIRIPLSTNLHFRFTAHGPGDNVLYCRDFHPTTLLQVIPQFSHHYKGQVLIQSMTISRSFDIETRGATRDSGIYSRHRLSCISDQNTEPLISLLDLENLEYLDLIDNHLEPEALQSIFGSLPKLKVVREREELSLRPRIQIAKAFTSNQNAFNNLSELQLCNDGELEITGLLQFIHRRELCGRRMKKLCLIGCDNLKEADRERMEMWVDCLVIRQYYARRDQVR